MNIQKIICIAQNSIPIIVIGKEEIKCNLLFKMISDRPYLTLHKKQKWKIKSRLVRGDISKTSFTFIMWQTLCKPLQTHCFSCSLI